MTDFWDSLERGVLCTPRLGLKTPTGRHSAVAVSEWQPPTARSVKRGRLSRDEIETLAPKTSTSCGGDPGPDSEVAGME